MYTSLRLSQSAPRANTVADTMLLIDAVLFRAPLKAAGATRALRLRWGAVCAGTRVPMKLCSAGAAAWPHLQVPHGRGSDCCIAEVLASARKLAENCDTTVEASTGSSFAEKSPNWL